MNPLPPLQKLFDTVAESIGQPNLGPEVQQRLKLTLQSVLADMDLVTREEFDAQTKVLQKTREKIELLEQEVAALAAEIEK